MRNLMLGFVLGLLVSGIAWANSASTGMQQPHLSRPDRLWELDRGASGREYLQQRQQEMDYELKLKQLRRAPLSDPC